MAKNKGIAAKFVIIVSVIISVIIAGIAGLLINKVQKSQFQMADGFVEMIKAEQKVEEKQLKENNKYLKTL